MTDRSTDGPYQHETHLTDHGLQHRLGQDGQDARRAQAQALLVGRRGGQPADDARRGVELHGEGEEAVLVRADASRVQAVHDGVDPGQRLGERGLEVGVHEEVEVEAVQLRAEALGEEEVGHHEQGQARGAACVREAQGRVVAREEEARVVGLRLVDAEQGRAPPRAPVEAVLRQRKRVGLGHNLRHQPRQPVNPRAQLREPPQQPYCPLLLLHLQLVHHGHQQPLLHQRPQRRAQLLGRAPPDQRMAVRVHPLRERLGRGGGELQAQKRVDHGLEGVHVVVVQAHHAKAHGAAAAAAAANAAVFRARLLLEEGVVLGAVEALHGVAAGVRHQPHRLPKHDPGGRHYGRRQVVGRVLPDVGPPAVCGAAALLLPGLQVPAVAAAPRAGVMEKDVVALVVTPLEARVALHAGRVRLAGAAVPAQVPLLESLAAHAALVGQVQRLELAHVHPRRARHRAQEVVAPLHQPVHRPVRKHFGWCGGVVG